MVTELVEVPWQPINAGHTCVSDQFVMIEFMKKKKNKKKQFSSVKALLKADREKEIEQYGKQVSLRPSRVHKSKKDYDRKKNKVQERDLE